MSGNARSPHPNALPNYEKAIIPRSKLEDYALNPAHKDGQHKARLFKRILGFDKPHWEELAKILLGELPFHEAVFISEGKYGKKFRVFLPLIGLTGNTAIVETIWIIRPGTDYPSFVTPRTIKEKR